MAKRTAIILACVAVVVFSNCVYAAEPAKRTREAGVLSLKEFSLKRSHRRATDAQFKWVKDLGLDPVWLPTAIFLPENKAERDTLKRIVVPYHAVCFTPAVTKGMTDYVRSGGLLITFSAMIGIDTDGDGKTDKQHPRTGCPLVGVSINRTAWPTKIRCLTACPLTKGMTLNEDIVLSSKVALPFPRPAGATIVVTMDGAGYKKRPFEGRPLLSFKHDQKGACIYLGTPSKEEHIAKLFGNVFSAETLEWLTAGE